MSIAYDLLRLAVMTAQSIRSSDGEEHTPDCEHAHCIEERLFRREMETMPEHRQAQSSWGSFMREIRDAAKREPISEFEIVDDVTI